MQNKYAIFLLRKKRVRITTSGPTPPPVVPTYSPSSLLRRVVRDTELRPRKR